MRRCARDTQPQRIGEEAIIGIQKRHVPSAARSPPGVPRNRQARVALTDVLDLGEVCRHSGCVIRGSVVDHDHLEVGERLTPDAAHGVPEKAAVVITGDHDGDHRPSRPWDH